MHGVNRPTSGRYSATRALALQLNEVRTMFDGQRTERPGFAGICIYALIAVFGLIGLALFCYLAWNTVATRRGSQGPVQENSRDRDPPPKPMLKAP